MGSERRQVDVAGPIPNGKASVRSRPKATPKAALRHFGFRPETEPRSSRTRRSPGTKVTGRARPQRQAPEGSTPHPAPPPRVQSVAPRKGFRHRCPPPGPTSSPPTISSSLVSRRSLGTAPRPPRAMSPAVEPSASSAPAARTTTPAPAPSPILPDIRPTLPARRPAHLPA